MLTGERNMTFVPIDTHPLFEFRPRRLETTCPTAIEHWYRFFYVPPMQSRVEGGGTGPAV